MGFIIHVSDDTEKEVRNLKGLIERQSVQIGVLIDAVGALHVEIQTLRKERQMADDVLLPISTSIKNLLLNQQRVLTDIARAVADLKGAQVPNAANVAALAKSIQDQADAAGTAADTLEAAEQTFENPPAPPAPTPPTEPAPPTP